MFSIFGNSLSYRDFLIICVNCGQVVLIWLQVCNFYENRLSAKRVERNAQNRLCFRISVKVVFPFPHTNTTSALTISDARFRMLCILLTHSIWLASLSCSVTPSFSAYSFTSREKRACASSSTSARWDFHLLLHRFIIFCTACLRINISVVKFFDKP